MKIRRAEKKDLDGIAALMVQLRYRIQDRKLRTSLEIILNDPREDIILMLDAEDHVVGVMYLRQHVSVTYKIYVVTVKETLIHPSYQQEEIESRFLAFARQYIENAKGGRTVLDIPTDAKGTLWKMCQEEDYETGTKCCVPNETA